jgi:hypothetical protein
MRDDDADLFFLLVQLLGHGSEDTHIAQPVESVLSRQTFDCQSLFKYREDEHYSLCAEE